MFCARHVMGGFPIVGCIILHGRVYRLIDAYLRNYDLLGEVGGDVTLLKFAFVCRMDDTVSCF